MENLPERPIDQLRRHDTAIELLEEHSDETTKELRELREMLRELREMYMSDRRVWKIAGKTMQVLGKWGIYVGAAAVGWAYSHWDKLMALHASEK